VFVLENESKAGIALPEGSVASLASQVVELKSEPSQLQSMWIAGTQYAAETASWAVRTEEFEQVLLKAIQS
jgi:hypothetical protein